MTEWDLTSPSMYYKFISEMSQTLALVLMTEPEQNKKNKITEQIKVVLATNIKHTTRKLAETELV